MVSKSFWRRLPPRLFPLILAAFLPLASPQSSSQRLTVGQPEKVVGKRKAAVETLEARERIVLNAARSRRFVEALLAPPRPPSPALLEAARAYRATVKSDLG